MYIPHGLKSYFSTVVKSLTKDRGLNHVAFLCTGGFTDRASSLSIIN